MATLAAQPTQIATLNFLAVQSTSSGYCLSQERVIELLFYMAQQNAQRTLREKQTQGST